MDLILVATYCAAAIAIFSVIFFGVCGILVLMDFAGVRRLPEGARKLLFNFFVVSVLGACGSLLAVVFSPQTLEQALQEREDAVSRAEVAEQSAETARAQEQASTSQLRAMDTSQSGLRINDVPVVTFIHRREGSRETAAQEMMDAITASGNIVPGIETLSFGPDQDQVRYFNEESQEIAQAIAEVAGLPDISMTFVPGYSVGPEHIEIWLAPE